MELKKMYSKVFMWMFVGLLVTFITGFYVSTQQNILNVIFSGLYLWLIIIEFILVIFLSSRITKMNPLTAKVSFILYSFLTGLTFSSIFVIYQIESIMLIFIISAILFGTFGLIGRYTKLDLSKIGTYLLMALFGIILCVIINMFLGNETFDIIISSISLLIFLGFTAYDIQKIKMISEYDNDNLAIICALQLYLDFINIFLDLLRLFGKSKN